MLLWYPLHASPAPRNLTTGRDLRRPPPARHIGHGPGRIKVKGGATNIPILAHHPSPIVRYPPFAGTWTSWVRRGVSISPRKYYWDRSSTRDSAPPGQFPLKSSAKLRIKKGSAW